MLKIKDNVDLKELEKFGFKKVKEDFDFEYQYFVNGSWEKIGILSSRHIYFEIMKRSIYGLIVEDRLSVLFDLIQAGLVEKVK